MPDKNNTTFFCKKLFINILKKLKQSNKSEIKLMFSHKLLSLLQTFSKYDLNRFRKFLHSPYFNDQEDIIQLFEAVNTRLRQDELAVAAIG